MKVLVPVLFLAGAGAALDTASFLAQAGPLLEKAKCALPCVDAAASKLKCGPGGPVDAVCRGLDTIKAQAAPCLTKCGIDAKIQEMVFKDTKNLCGKRDKKP